MKKTKRKIIFSFLIFALTAMCLSFSNVNRHVVATTAEHKLPADYVTLSDDSATFAYQILPQAYQNVFLYGNKESSNITGAMVFTAINNDASAEVDVAMSFSTVISARQLTQSFNLLEYLVITDEMQQASDYKGDAPPFNSISLTLSEKENPKNYIKISNIPSRYHNYASIVRASATGVSEAGMDKLGNFYDSSGLLSGSGINGSLSGCYLNGNNLSSIYSVSYKFDTPSMTVYASHCSTDNKEMLVRDLDSPSHMLGLDKAFQGFYSDELVATLSVDGLKGKAQIAVLGFNGAVLYGDSEENIVDNNAPSVFATNYIDGVEAEMGVEFPIFDFSSYDDIDGVAPIDACKVYYDYGKLTQKEMSVVDGVFVPEREGLYTILAEKQDSSQNKGIAMYTVKALKKLPPFMLSLQEEIPLYGVVGTTITLPKAIASGGTVGTDYTLRVVHDSKDVEIDKWNGLFLQKQGLYTIEYSVFDYRQVPYVFSYYIDARLEKAPIVEFPNMPSHVSVGSILKIPAFSAIDWYSYAGMPCDAIVSASVSKQGENPQTIEGDYVVETEGTFTYTLTAKSLQGTESVSKSYEITALRTELVSDYFVREKVEIVGEEEMIFEAKENGASVSFINPLPVQNFAFKFNIPKEYSGFENVAVVFSDKDTLNECVTAECANGGITFCGKTVKTNSTFGGSDFALSFKDFTLRNLADVLGTIDNFDNGAEFTGFSSGYVYVRLVFSGVYGKAGIQIKTIGNHSYFEKDATDISAPIVYIQDEIRSIVKIGEIFQIPQITAYDVFEGEKEVKLRVLRGKEKVAVSEDNTFAINSFGTYVLRIEVTDSTGHKTTINKNIYCHNQTGPIIVVQDKVATSGKVGKSIQIAPAIATDYFGTEVQVRVFVLKKGGAYVMVDENNRFTPDEATDYVIWYTATDSDFNTSIIKFVVKV